MSRDDESSIFEEISAFDFTDGIHIDTSEDKEVKIQFDEQTLGVVHGGGTTGYSITNDWNNRHFTIGFNENSILYHVTREDIDDRMSGKQSINRSEYVAELYGYVRWIAPPIPKDRVPFDIVGILDFEATKQYFTEKQVVEYTDDGLSVDFDKEETLITDLIDNPGEVGELFETILDSVSFDNIRDSDEIVFFRPSATKLHIIFLYPGEYVGVVEAQEFFKALEGGGGSQIIDHAIRSIAIE